MLTALFVVARIVANPVSNVFQKQLALRGANPIFIIAATHALLTLAAVPVLIALPWPEVGGGFWINILLCTSLAVASNILLVYALRESDLSLLGPINAYKSVLSLVLGIFLLGEVPTLFGVAGVLLVLLGSYGVIDRVPGQPRGQAIRSFFRDRGIQLRLAALLLSATEAVFLKRAILQSSPLTTFLFWSILGFPFALLALSLLPRGAVRREARGLRANGRLFLWLALTTAIMQGATLYTFGTLQVGYSLALFQLSTLISVVLGYRYFAESNIRRRLFGSTIMVLGAILIVTLGR